LTPIFPFPASVHHHPALPSILDDVIEAASIASSSSSFNFSSVRFFPKLDVATVEIPEGGEDPTALLSNLNPFFRGIDIKMRVDENDDEGDALVAQDEDLEGDVAEHEVCVPVPSWEYIYRHRKNMCQHQKTSLKASIIP
jgi:hypothetical protein